MKVSIILPARNEEKHIKSALTDVVGYLEKKKYSFEVIVVVNGSQDDTYEISQLLAKKLKQVKVVKSKPGYGFALRKGLAESRGDYIVIFNVDFYDFRLIDLIDIDLYGKDFIIGSKRAHWSKDERPRQRKLVSFLFNIYLRGVHGFKGSDTHGIKIIKREVVDRIYRRCKTNSGVYDTEIVLRAQNEGFKIADFPVDVKEKRPSRFPNRFFRTPIDIYQLHRALKE